MNKDMPKLPKPPAIRIIKEDVGLTAIAALLMGIVIIIVIALS